MIPLLFQAPPRSRKCYGLSLAPLATLALLASPGLASPSPAASQAEFEPYRLIAGDQANGIVDAVPADLDRDGDMDLLVGSTTDRGLGWYENDGTGSFARSVSIGPAVVGCAAVGAADMDGDGFDDVLVMSRISNDLVWLRNLGGGDFGAPRAIAESNLTLHDFATGDLDGDGDLDVVLSTGSRIIGWFENLGGGQFGGGARDLGANSNWVRAVLAVYDVDLDGDDDIVASNDGAITFLNDGTGASWTSSYTDLPGVNHSAEQVAVADLDGDGDLDLAVAAHRNSHGTGEIVWLRNDGGVLAAAQVLAGAQSLYGVAAADFDGDGDVDLLASSGAWGWLENVGGGSFAGLATLGIIGVGGAATAADFSGDGLPDALAMSRFEEGGLYWSRNLGAGAFSAMVEVTATNIEQPTVMGALDYDLDGDLDLLCAAQGDGTLYSYENLGALAFGPQTVVESSLTSPTQLAVGDLDGDGDDDIVVTANTWVNVILNLGGGAFAPSVELPLPVGVCAGLELADFDADGLLDLAYSTGSRELAVCRGLGGGSFAQPTVLVPSSFRPRGIDSIDLDADGDLDLVVASDQSFSGRVVTFENVGALSFGPEVLVLGQQPFDFDEVDRVAAFRDPVSGGAVVVGQGSDELRSSRQNASGQFTGQQYISGGGHITNGVDVGDVDGDGLPDIVQGAIGEILFASVVVYRGGDFTTPEFVTGAADFVREVLVADLDGDGDDDIVVTSHRDDSIGFCEARGVPAGGIGTAYCAGATLNSTGAPGSIFLRGTADASINALSLVAEDLPPSSFGFFLGSLSTDLVANAFGSQGTMCLGGSLARFSDSAQRSTIAGSSSFEVDLSAIPLMPQLALQAGDTFHFQYWHRDVNPGATTNFTNAVSIVLE